MSMPFQSLVIFAVFHAARVAQSLVPCGHIDVTNLTPEDIKAFYHRTNRARPIPPNALLPNGLLPAAVVAAPPLPPPVAAPPDPPVAAAPPGLNSNEPVYVVLVSLLF